MKPDPKHDNFEPDETVEWSEWVNHRSSLKRGTVLRVTPGMVVVAPTDGSEPRRFRRRRCTWQPFECRRVDILREQWLRDIEEWWEHRPSTVHLRLSPLINREGARVAMDAVRIDLDVMRRVADEAETIREWLRKRPQEPAS